MSITDPRDVAPGAVTLQAVTDPSARLCGAKLRRKDATCRQPAMRGKTRCRLHGGASLAGAAHPGFKDGRHSRYLPMGLRRRYAAALSDPTLLDLRRELGLVDVRIGQLLESLGAPGADVDAVWAALAGLITLRRRLVRDEARRARDLGRFIEVERVMTLFRALAEAVRQHVSDPTTLRDIQADLARVWPAGHLTDQ